MEARRLVKDTPRLDSKSKVPKLSDWIDINKNSPEKIENPQPLRSSAFQRVGGKRFKVNPSEDKVV